MSRRARRVFTREEKADAVGLVRRSGLSIAQISRDLDIGENSLRSWVKQADIDDGRGPDGGTDDDGAGGVTATASQGSGP